MPSSGTKPLTRVLARSVPGGSRVKGRAYQLEGAVRKITGTPWTADATVKGSRAYAVDIHRDERGHLTASCDCPYFTDRFVICKHIWAALLEAERRGYLLGDGDLPESATIEPVDRGDASDPEYATRAETARRAGREKARRPRPWEQFLEEFSRNLAQAESLPAAPRFADAQIVYVIDRAATIGGETLALDLQSRQRKKNGEWGRPKPAPVGSADLGQLPDAVDRQIVPLLLGAADPQITGHFYMSQFARASFRLAPPLVDRVLPLVAQSGRAFLRVQPSPGEQLVQLAWDDGPAWTFRLEIVHASGDEGFSIDGALIRGSERLAVRAPWLVLASGYIIHGNRIARLDPRGAFAWLSQLRGSGPMVIPPGATGQLLDVLARSGVDPSDLPDELQFEIVNESPRPSVSVRADTRVTPASPAANLHATVTFDYGGHIVEPGSGATTFDSVRRLLIRRDLAGRAGRAQPARAGRVLAAVGLRVRPPALRDHHRPLPGRRPRAGRRRLARRSGRAHLPLGRVDAIGRAIRHRLVRAARLGRLRRRPGGRAPAPARGLPPRPRDGDAGRRDDRDRAGGMAAELGGHRRRRRGGRRSRPLQAVAGGAARRGARGAAGGQRRRTLRARARRAVVASAASRRSMRRRRSPASCATTSATGSAGSRSCASSASAAASPTTWGSARPSWCSRCSTGSRAHEAGDPRPVARRRAALGRLQLEGGGRALRAEAAGARFHAARTARVDRLDRLRRRPHHATARCAATRCCSRTSSSTTRSSTRRRRSRTRTPRRRRRRGCSGAKHRLALSGTPIENHLGELWSLFEFLNPGLLGDRVGLRAASRRGREAGSRARSTCCRAASGRSSCAAPRSRSRRSCRREPSRRCYCELEAAQRELYDELRDHYRAALLGRIARDGLAASRRCTCSRRCCGCARRRAIPA